VLDDLTEVVLHEVGHTLGLRHNFRASTCSRRRSSTTPRSRGQRRRRLGDGIQRGQHRRQGQEAGRVQHDHARSVRLLGDRVRLQGDRPGSETAELARIAARNSEPLLAYATDEDAAFAIDPEASQADLGGDPIEFARRRFLLVQEMWDRWQVRRAEAGENYLVYRRIVERGITAMTGRRPTWPSTSAASPRCATTRQHAAPLTPVDARQQRTAIRLIADGMFSADSFRFKPEFMRRVQVDWLDRGDIFDIGLSTPGVDYSLTTQVLNAQRKVLNQLMSDIVAQRILDSEVKVADPKAALHLSELYDTLKDFDLERASDRPRHLADPAQPAARAPRAARERTVAAERHDAGRRPGAAARGGAFAAARARRRAEPSRYSKEARAHSGGGALPARRALKAPIVRQASDAERPRRRRRRAAE
jgi:hypothetical protein